MTQFHFRECAHCGNEKPDSDFYPSNKSKCKTCVKSLLKIERLTNPKVQERDRERSKQPHRVEQRRSNNKKWREKNPEAYKAQTAVGNALRDKKLFKMPCQICGSNKNIHAHHDDYSKPLDVKWLCAKCHHRLHAAFPQLGGHYVEAAE